MEPTLWRDMAVKYESPETPCPPQKDHVYANLTFSSVAACEDDEYGYSKKKVPRDPLSHRIIEKRRRDRMNNCLADLSRLIPSEYMKKGRGRVEKTEIIEMAIRHMKHLQTRPCSEGSCCISREEIGVRPPDPDDSLPAEHYRLGFTECLSETIHFLVEVEGFFANDSLCLQLSTHLQKHCENILKGKGLKAQLSSVSQGKRRFSRFSDDPSEKQVGEMREEISPFPRGCYPEAPVLHNLEPPMHQYGSPFQEGPPCCPTSRPIPYPQQMSPPVSCPSEKGDSSGSIVGSYKFKEKIRKRFCREVGGTGGAGGTGCRVPGFALSPHGPYYVPLSVDMPPSPDILSDPVLHPVTISVCFAPTTNSPPHPSSVSGP